jgi:hypothetical protein
MRWGGVSSFSSCLCFRIRRDGPIDLETLASRIVAIIGRVKVEGAKVIV